MITRSLKSTGILCILGLLAVSLAQTHPGFSAKGRFLYDKCDNKVILRGVNEMLVWSDPQGTVLPEIARSGANCVRIMWMMGKQLSESDAAVTKCRQLGMIPILEIHDATGDWARLGSVVDYWCRQNSVDLIKKHQEYLIVNIANECGGSAVAGSEFVSAYSNAVSRMRTAGIHVPLMIDADRWGRNVAQLLASGPALVNGDPDKNLIFSWHAWDSNAPRSTYDNAISGSIQKNICLVIGEFAHKEVGCRCCIDYKYILEACQKNQIGWMAWSWGKVTNADCAEMDMTRGGSFSTLSGWGLEVATTDPNSIKNTAVLSPFVVTGSCGGIDARMVVDKTSGPRPLTVAFDGSVSTGAGLTYAWKFGDGQTGSGAKINHTYQTAGSYQATLVVTAGTGKDSAQATITVVDPSKEPVKISCGKAAIASSEENGQVGAFPASRAVDCDASTRWASNTTDSEWIYIDLGASQSFGRVILRWETAYASTYALQVSDDALAWTDKASITNGNGGNDTLDLSATGRYVRMRGVTRGTQYGYSLYEFEIYQLPMATQLWPHDPARGVHSVFLNRGPGIMTDLRGRIVALGSWPGLAESTRGAGMYMMPGAQGRRIAADVHAAPKRVITGDSGNVLQ